MLPIGLNRSRRFTAASSRASTTRRAQGRLAAEQAAEARAEITRRMLAAADQESRETRHRSGSPAETSRRIGAALGIAAVLPVSALVIYFAVGAPAAIDPTRAAPPPTGTPHDRAELSAVADQLKARLLREPGHKEGWVLLGRTFASLGRFAEAREAYGRAIALAPNEPELHAELGELLVLAAGGAVTPEAAGRVRQVRQRPARPLLWRGSRAAARRQRRRPRRVCVSLLADAPADAPWRKIVADRLAEISRGERQTGVAGRPARPPLGRPRRMSLPPRRCRRRSGRR